MINNKSSKKSSSMRGQLSIFAALIFQVLFVIFAMSLNIALVVHDKINLQNSVDLAAYYGAMKQAQMLNAIAHINYQIRQSWKLFAWRNKVLGNIGTQNTPPLNEDREFIPRNFQHVSPQMPGTFITCIGHDKWHHPQAQSQTSDNTCHSINGQLLEALEIGPSEGSLFGFQAGFDKISRVITRQNTLVGELCEHYGKANWLFAATVFANWMKDQTDRKLMIYHLARHMANNKDLSNDSLKQGSRKTLIKNLSFVNKKSLSANKLQFFNSLENAPPEKWLKDHTFFVNLMYSFSKTNGRGCTKYVRFIDQRPPVPATPELSELINYINNLLHTQRVGVDLCKPTGNPRMICPGSAGLNKKTDFLIFYGVKAELDYKGQIFLPFGDIKLKAEAYAKPFGGRIGPLNPPERENRADKLLPLPLTEAQRLPHQQDAEGIRRYDLTLSPNYSRYPGDHLGLRSHIVQHHWFSFLKEQVITTKDITHYSHGGQDPLAFKPGDNQSLINTLPARQWEVAAIAPDLFDTTYFTILPSYSEDYFGKVKSILESQNQAHIIRGDLGWRADFNPASPPPHTSLIRHQIQNIWDILKRQDPQGNFSKPFYKLHDPSFLLTGWNPPKVKYHPDTDYQHIRQSNFGTCHKWDRDIAGENLKKRVAGACVEGGRTGYSVKMISRHFLEKLAPGTGAGNLSNPQPSWW